MADDVMKEIDQTAEPETQNTVVINPTVLDAKQIQDGDAEFAHKRQFGERTEAQILLRAPITVQLAGRDYSIRPAVVRVAREWGKAYAETIGELLRVQTISSDDAESFGAGMSFMLGGLPDKGLELIFLYASEVDRVNGNPLLRCYLPKEEIEDGATAEEIALALQKVVKLAQSPLGLTATAMAG